MAHCTFPPLLYFSTLSFLHSSTPLRLRLTLEYDGSGFAGWQVQPAQRTVQGELEAAFARIVGQPVAVVGSGRTDAGVHARGQVAHADVPDWFGDGDGLARLVRGLGALTGPDMAVLDVVRAPDTFHARYDARRRVYHYHTALHPRALDRATRVLVRPAPDVEAMNAAAAHLLGAHHFGAFCRTQSETENRVCTLYAAVWEPEARGGDWRFRVEGNRFLHGMVRALVGTLWLVGRGRLSPADLPGILATEDRRAAGPAAPPHGLVLHAVHYGDPVEAERGAQSASSS